MPVASHECFTFSQVSALRLIVKISGLSADVHAVVAYSVEM